VWCGRSFRNRLPGRSQKPKPDTVGVGARGPLESMAESRSARSSDGHVELNDNSPTDRPTGKGVQNQTSVHTLRGGEGKGPRSS